MGPDAAANCPPFLLPAVAEALLEYAVLVAQTITRRRQRHGRHRIEEAGRQPPETPVAEARVRLLVQKLHPLAAVLIESLAHHRIEDEIEDVVGERAADQKLNRDVIDPLRVLAFVSLVGPKPTVGENVPDRACGRVVAFARVGSRGIDDVVGLQVPLVKRVRSAGEHRRAASVAAQKRGGVRSCLHWSIKVLHVVHWPFASPPKTLISAACDALATLVSVHTLSPSVEVAPRAPPCPHVQFLISGMSSP